MILISDMETIRWVIVVALGTMLCAHRVASGVQSSPFHRSLLPSDEIRIEYPPLLSEPIATYPVYNNLLRHLSAWNPDDPDPPAVFQETLQHFNFSDPSERRAALAFRNAELPFKLHHVPNVDSVVNKWTDDYLQKVLEQDDNTNTLISKDNHFQYWKKQKERKYIGAQKENRPTSNIRMPFSEWLKLAQAADRKKLPADQPHYYFRKNNRATDKHGTFVGRDLSIFRAEENNFFISDVSANKGVQCRFGMRGIIAESHWDSGRNMVALLKGRKRYILNPPQACRTLGVNVDEKHPSFRHSMVDWSDLAAATKYNFDKADSIETIMNAGEVLYIPSYWFHYVVSLEYNIQCNSRSGSPKSGVGQDLIKKCLRQSSNARYQSMGVR